MLRRAAPAWVFLPPGGALADSAGRDPAGGDVADGADRNDEGQRQADQFGEAIKISAMASFFRQRKPKREGAPPDPDRFEGPSGRPRTILARRDRPGSRPAPHTPWPGGSRTALRLTSNTVVPPTPGLRCGALTWGKALAISEATSDLPDHAAQAVEAHVLKRAASRPTGTFWIPAPPGRQTHHREAGRQTPRRGRRAHLQDRPAARWHGRALDRPHRRQDPADVGHHPSNRRPRQTRPRHPTPDRRSPPRAPTPSSSARRAVEPRLPAPAAATRIPGGHTCPDPGTTPRRRHLQRRQFRRQCRYARGRGCRLRMGAAPVRRGTSAPPNSVARTWLRTCSSTSCATAWTGRPAAARSTPTPSPHRGRRPRVHPAGPRRQPRRTHRLRPRARRHGPPYRPRRHLAPL